MPKKKYFFERKTGSGEGFFRVKTNSVLSIHSYLHTICTILAMHLAGKAFVEWEVFRMEVKSLYRLAGGFLKHPDVIDFHLLWKNGACIWIPHIVTPYGNIKQ
ncbi:hypothetical protein SAMN05444412_109141 [Rhodonellum ikkaensis]|uniref:Uncharacterized protein n=1 Tax=Rhodonellum ikkaensis TaxID=336829 RepID=A0A1H3RW05_9BACT|nr:hypothetical protein SAMN05444412_109141 [Rhodonellum ikkaensis]